MSIREAFKRFCETDAAGPTGNYEFDLFSAGYAAAISEAEKQEPVAYLNKILPHMAVLTKPDDGGGWLMFNNFCRQDEECKAYWPTGETK